MRFLLLLALLSSFFVSELWAKSYSCRDSQGRVHFSDNLQGLPQECAEQATVVTPGKTGNLNVVPAPKTESSQGQNTLQTVEREQQQRQEYAQQLRLRAETLQELYQQGIQEKWQVKTGWGHNKRKRIKEVNDKLLQVLEEKQELLDELGRARIPTRDREAIEKILAELDDDINAE